MPMSNWLEIVKILLRHPRKKRSVKVTNKQKQKAEEDDSEKYNTHYEQHTASNAHLQYHCA